MKSKNKYTQQEIEKIKSLLQVKDNTTNAKQKNIRAKIRDIGFYISDFKKSGDPFTIEDFNNLIENGEIKISRRFSKISESFSKNKFVLLIISNPYKTGMFILSLLTFLIVWLNYRSPADIKHEMILVQRPDSVYQAQIYIWNEGDESVNKIVLLTNKENVFLSDTSKKRKKLNLQIYPNLSVESSLTPSKVLNKIGNVIEFKKNRIEIESLPKSNKNENVFILIPSLVNIQKLKKMKDSIFREKYIELNTCKNSNYISELRDNIQLSAQGKILKLQFSKILSLTEIDTLDYFFPTEKHIDEYKKYAIAPYYTIPPLQIIKKIKEEEDDNDGGYKKFNKYRGYKTY